MTWTLLTIILLLAGAACHGAAGLGVVAKVNWTAFGWFFLMLALAALVANGGKL